MSQEDLTARRALVTGGTRGIGAATATLLRDRGAEVMITGRRAPDEPPAGVEFVAADLAADGGPQALAETVLQRWDEIDILVDNAGGQTVHGRVGDFSDEDWQRDLQLNLLAPVALDRALLPALIRRGGTIVHVSSTVARMPEPAVVAYAAAKAALAVYSKALAREVGPQGVRVNAVFPGFTATEMFVGRFRAESEAQQRPYAEHVAAVMRDMGVPLGRPAEPGEVAAVIAFLASPAASYVTGAQLMAEGGVLPAVF